MSWTSYPSRMFGDEEIRKLAKQLEKLRPFKLRNGQFLSRLGLYLRDPELYLGYIVATQPVEKAVEIQELESIDADIDYYPLDPDNPTESWALITKLIEAEAGPPTCPRKTGRGWSSSGVGSPPQRKRCGSDSGRIVLE